MKHKMNDLELENKQLKKKLNLLQKRRFSAMNKPNIIE